MSSPCKETRPIQLGVTHAPHRALEPAPAATVAQRRHVMALLQSVGVI